MRSSTGLVISGLVLGLFLVVFGIPLAMGKVKPNDLYGFRTPKTLENADLWYKSNAFAGKALTACGVVIIVLSAALPFAARGLGLEESAMRSVAIAIELVPVIAAAVISYIYTARL